VGQTSNVKAFLGVGWAFPPCVSTDGKIILVEFENDIRESIRIILGTDRGERVMRPDFGAGLNQFVFEPINATTLNLVKTRVQESLIAWEPRIDVLSVAVNSDGDVHNKLLIDVSYRVRATNSQFNLVFPFYLQEGPAG
jgi:phage baseplate assembly protein W